MNLAVRTGTIKKDKISGDIFVDIALFTETSSSQFFRESSKLLRGRRCIEIGNFQTLIKLHSLVIQT